MSQSQKEIKYEEQYVAFLDVLGFKALVVKDNKCVEISKYFSIVRNAVIEMQGINQKKDIRPIIISDSIILTVPANAVDDNKVSTLRQLCIAIRTIQQQLALENIWIRGAVCLGEVYCNLEQNNIVGPAYIEAYEMEKKALYPRVIIDPKIIKTLRRNSAGELIKKINNPNGVNEEILYDVKQCHANALKMDLPLFIDYLSPIFSDKSRVGDGVKIIDNLTKRIYEDIEVYSKYRWVADYISSFDFLAGYNNACEEKLTNKFLSLFEL